jgi:putative ABC transport system ATP-binding protein
VLSDTLPPPGSGETTTPFLELDSVSRVYGEQVKVYALREVSLKIMPGDFMSIVGPSGSGKSTMLGLLGCLDLPTDGKIFVAGDDVTTMDDAGRTHVRGHSIGFVFQQFHLIPYLSALGNVETALLYRGIKPSERHQRSMHALERVGLGPRADHRPVQLSGGEQQRVALARALVTDPIMLLADEPTGALDSHTGEGVLRVLRERCDAGAAGLLVTHEARHAAWADRVVFLRDGVVVDSTGAPESAEALLEPTA